MLAPLEAQCRVCSSTRCCATTNSSSCRSAARRSDVSLRVYGSYDGSISDLSFLRFFPDTRRLRVDVFELSPLDGLGLLSIETEYLGLGRTRRRLDLEPLRRFGGLTQLFLEGHTKNFEVVSSLVNLVDVTLRSITLPDLEPLLPLRSLRALDLKLGGTSNLCAVATGRSAAIPGALDGERPDRPQAHLPGRVVAILPASASTRDSVTRARATRCSQRGSHRDDEGSGRHLPATRCTCPDGVAPRRHGPLATSRPQLPRRAPDTPRGEDRSRQHQEKPGGGRTPGLPPISGSTKDWRRIRSEA